MVWKKVQRKHMENKRMERQRKKKMLSKMKRTQKKNWKERWRETHGKKAGTTCIWKDTQIERSPDLEHWKKKSMIYLEWWRQCWCWGLGLLMCAEGGGLTLLEVISADYRGRVQRTTVPCNLPPWKIDAADEWSDTCTYSKRWTRGWIVVKTNWTAWGDDKVCWACMCVWNYNTQDFY